MSTVPVDIPPTVSVTVPVSCTQCNKDMTYTISYKDAKHRHWSLHCTYCGREEDEQRQSRRQLWANGSTIYVGSYWGPDD